MTADPVRRLYTALKAAARGADGSIIVRLDATDHADLLASLQALFRGETPPMLAPARGFDRKTRDGFAREAHQRVVLYAGWLAGRGFLSTQAEAVERICGPMGLPREPRAVEDWFSPKRHGRWFAVGRTLGLIRSRMTEAEAGALDDAGIAALIERECGPEVSRQEVNQMASYWTHLIRQTDETVRLNFSALDNT